MKKLFITVFLIFISTSSSFAQGERLEFGISVFPNISQGLVFTDLDKPDVVENLTWKFSFAVQLFAEYRINERSLIGAGSGIQNTGSRLKKYEIVNPSVDPAHDFFAQNYNNNNLEVPLYYKYKIGQRFYVQPGVSGVLRLSNSTRTLKWYGNEKVSERTFSPGRFFRTINISVNLGFGIDYYKNDSFTLFVHPYAQYALFGVLKESIYNRNPLSIGLVTGMRI